MYPIHKISLTNFYKSSQAEASVLTREGSDSSSGLTLEEIQQTETKLFLLHQKQFYSDELKTLKSGSTLPNTNPLCSLFPILDQAGLMRVGGRLQQANISYQQKHPIIIHRKSHLALLLVQHLHNSNHHPGPTMMLALLSQQYYMSGARILVRAVSHKCITCRKEYAKVASQCMGQLPEARITPSPPFTKTGTDFAGPLLLKKGHTRKPVIVKGYVCLFICLSTRAVHLELVMDLSTDAFLAAFRRFTARRGCPGDLYSDNGSNYIGADRELRQIYDLLSNKDSSDTLCRYFNNSRVKWHFIPGRAPHFGGLWESAIKAAKSFIRKIVGTHSMTVEECISVLNEVEAILNSTPLCTLNVSPEDGVEVLTSAHFLVGRSLKAPPQATEEELVISHRRRWNLCQHLTHQFWKRWTTDYL